MHIEYHKQWSACLGQEMEFKVYGQAGKPALVFPAQCGRFYEFEDFGMIEAAAWFIDQGLCQFYTADSIDSQSWANQAVPPQERARRHLDYDRYIASELVPYIRSRAGQGAMLLSTGVSMGGYHSANFFFRHPELCDALLSLSGVFQPSLFTGDCPDEVVVANSPIHLLQHLEDPLKLELFRRSRIIICAGQGAWEEAMLQDIEVMRSLLQQKAIPAWIDLWGYDVCHDWPWWRRMLPYFLSKLLDCPPPA